MTIFPTKWRAKGCNKVAFEHQPVLPCVFFVAIPGILREEKWIDTKDVEEACSSLPSNCGGWMGGNFPNDGNMFCDMLLMVQKSG